MVIGAHIWGENVEQSKLLFALRKVSSIKTEVKIILFVSSSSVDVPNNFVKVLISPKPKNKLLLYYWYQYKLPRLLTKYNITTFISNTGMLASYKTSAQHLFVEDQNMFAEKNRFFNGKINDAIENAKKIFIVDDFLGAQFAKAFPKHLNKLQQLNFNISEKPILFSVVELEEIKVKYTGGLDYYLFPINSSSKVHVVTVLKAFSQLKKWQKTSIKLVFLFEETINENFLPDFKNYKHKNDVVLIAETNENKAQINASAFCYIYLSDYNSHQNVFYPLQYEVPVIAADADANRLLFSSAISYSAISVEELARQLQLIYKDEAYNRQLLFEGKAFINTFDNEAQTQKFLEAISN